MLFQATDLEHFSKTQIDSILLTVLGSPDNSGRQVDGLGGGFSSLSKAAIISPSSKPGIDVEFNFAQVDIETSFVDWTGTCGTITSAVGPFAINQGLVELTFEIVSLPDVPVCVCVSEVVELDSSVESDSSVEGTRALDS